MWCTLNTTHSTWQLLEYHNIVHTYIQELSLDLDIPQSDTYYFNIHPNSQSCGAFFTMFVKERGSLSFRSDFVMLSLKTLPLHFNILCLRIDCPNGVLAHISCTPASALLLALKLLLCALICFVQLMYY